MTKRKALRTLDPNLLPAKAKAPDAIANDDYQPCSDGDSDYIPAATGRKRSARLASKATVTDENTPSQDSQHVPAAHNLDKIQPSRPTKRKKQAKSSRNALTVAQGSGEVPVIPNYDQEATLRWFLGLPDVDRYNLREKLADFFNSVRPNEQSPSEPTAVPPTPPGSFALSTTVALPSMSGSSTPSTPTSYPTLLQRLHDLPAVDLNRSATRFNKPGTAKHHPSIARSPSSPTPWDPSAEYPDLPEEEIGDLLEADDPTLSISLDDAVQSIIDTTNTPAEDDWWPSTDPTIDQKWDQFISDQVNMFGEQPQDYVKPSGTLSCNLLIQWHYPTYKTTSTGFGLDADISNPCTRMMFKKYRLDSDFDKDILVMERIWKRFDIHSRSDRRSNIAPYDDKPEAWRDQHTSFSDWLWTESQAKVVFVIGARNVQSFQARHPNLISIKINETRWFGHKACVWLMMKDGQVTRIIIPSYHTEALFRGLSSDSTQLMDVVWNLAAAMTKRMFVNNDYFQWFGKTSNCSEDDCPQWDEFRGSWIALVTSIRAYEIRRNVQFPQEALPSAVRSYIQKEKFHPSPSEGSVMSQLLRYMSAKGRVTNAAAGYRCLAKGHATMAAAGYPGLVKGRAINAALGHPELVKGRATQAAAGHPNMAKGRAINAALGHPELAKGRATQAAAGYPNLVKGRATSTARGHPGLVKARATYAANGYPNLAKGRAAQAAAGWPSLARGRAKGVLTHAARGHPNLAKGRAMMAAAGEPGLAKARDAQALAVKERDAKLSPEELAILVKRRLYMKEWHRLRAEREAQLSHEELAKVKLERSEARKAGRGKKKSAGK